MQLHKPTFRKIQDHEFSKVIIEAWPPIMQLEQDDVEFNKWTQLQRYQYYVCSTFGQVLNKGDHIDQAKILTHSYPDIRAWRKHYGQSQYLQYHAEVYLAGVAGLIDRLLLVINYTYSFGTPHNHVRMRSVLDNLTKSKDTTMHSLVVLLKDRSSDTKELRDKAMHWTRYDHRDLSHLALIEHLIKEGNGTDADFSYLKGDISFLTYFFRRSIADEIEKIEGDLIPLVEKLLTELLERYRLMCEYIIKQSQSS